MSDFNKRVKDHMANYKTKVLQIQKNGEFSYRGNSKKYAHILPKDDERMNILPYKKWDGIGIIRDVKLHKYFHHLNSSQAMCINFFYPLIKEQKLEIILNILGIDGNVDYNNVAFEKESNIDIGYGRCTNFDFYLSTKEGKHIYFEIKYTEKEFGKAPDDLEHDQKYRELYEPLLNANAAISNKYKEKKEFLENYQVLRNLIHINENAWVVFIYPNDNEGIKKGILNLINKIIVANWKKHLITITWEDILIGTLNATNDIDLIKYYNNTFFNKYMI